MADDIRRWLRTFDDHIAATPDYGRSRGKEEELRNTQNCIACR